MGAAAGVVVAADSASGVGVDGALKFAVRAEDGAVVGPAEGSSAVAFAIEPGVPIGAALKAEAALLSGTTRPPCPVATLGRAKATTTLPTASDMPTISASL